MKTRRNALRQVPEGLPISLRVGCCGHVLVVKPEPRAQVIMATHSPILMALPNADLLEVTRYGIAPVDYRETQHFKLYQSFTVAPEDFIAKALADEAESAF